MTRREFQGLSCTLAAQSANFVACALPLHAHIVVLLNNSRSSRSFNESSPEDNRTPVAVLEIV